MILTINTTENSRLEIGLQQGKKNLVLLEQPVNRDQAEKLLPMVEEMLKKQGIGLDKLTKIVVGNGQGSFTSLRIGISTANALGYALGIPVEDNNSKSKRVKGIHIAIPKYYGAPDITKSKK
ncbi:MAG: tRNA (adenosine(37)-N6)-threonylcarbamoyltransferase complex dimerization subunit type 1 TsaB [bacterium]